MNPGREFDTILLNALIDAKLLAWKKGFHNHAIDQPEVWTDEKGHPAVPPPYSTNIAAAWEVFDKMHGHVERRGHPMPGEEWFAQMWLGGQGEHAYGSTAPLAICLAALKTVGVTPG